MCQTAIGLLDSARYIGDLLNEGELTLIEGQRRAGEIRRNSADDEREKEAITSSTSRTQEHYYQKYHGNISSTAEFSKNMQ